MRTGRQLPPHGKIREKPFDRRFAKVIGMNLFTLLLPVETQINFDPCGVARFGRFCEIHRSARRRKSFEEFHAPPEMRIGWMSRTDILAEMFAGKQENS